MKVIVASSNPAKILAARLGFSAMFGGTAFSVSGISVPSGVSGQPLSRPETERGALNRVESARTSLGDADYWIGMEGGLEERNGRLWTIVAIAVMDAAGRTGTGTCGSFVLPAKVADLVRAGKELGEADDIVFGLRDSKKDLGAVGILTGGALPRAEYYAQGVILALIPFRNWDMY